MGILITITIVLVLVCTGTVWYIQEKNRTRELADISTALECILNGKKIKEGSLCEETLSSKIRSQIFRLQNMTLGYHTRIKQDRDSIKRLIAEISHQLRMPLTNIEMYLDFLQQEGNSTEEQKTYLEAVAASERKIHFLVESFIRMSRLENRIIQIQKTDTDLLFTLQSAVSQVRKMAEGRKITIQMQFPEKVSYAHDAGWLSEAVFNLLDNAVKYSKEGSKVILGADQNEMTTHIWVRDYGVGIEAGEEEKVFQRFYRGKNAAKIEGFGLGLYLTREIVLQHHGFARIKRKETGTLAELYMPRGNINYTE